MMRYRRLINLLLGPALMGLAIFLLPVDLFPTLAARASVGTVTWMSYWWVSAPVDYAITAFLPIAVNALIPMTNMKNIIANYSSETILLLLGASILTVFWEETGLDRRIAAKFLGVVGNNFRKQLMFWFILSAFFSSVLPNAVVCATITPIAVAMLRFVGHGDIANSRLGSKLLLYIAYGAGIGGLATPLGGAMNLVTVDYLQQLTGKEFMYVSWIIKFSPVMIILLISNIFFMLRDIGREENIGGSSEYFLMEYKKMPPMSSEEKWALLMFVAATLLSFTRQFYQTILPGLKPAYVFVICAMMSFLIVKHSGERLMRWQFVQTKIVWGLIYVFAGGLAAGSLINDSGAAKCIGIAVSGMNLSGGLFTIAIIVTLTLLLSDITSNTATAAIAMPVVISIIQGIGLNPIPFIYIASIGVNLSYMLPTSIRAIPVGYGLQPKYMFQEGWKLTLIVLVLMIGTSYLLLNYWMLFSEL